jgi:hypothetical protein
VSLPSSDVDATPLPEGGEGPGVRARAIVRVAFLCLPLAACSWSPSRPFDRESPEVNLAIAVLDGGDATLAAQALEEYLSTGPCADSNIGTPELLKKRPSGGFDLGLSLFKIGETFGRRFGEEEADRSTAPGSPSMGTPPQPGQAPGQSGVDDKTKGLRAEQVGCAVRVLAVVANDATVPVELRARAHYLEGNLDFLDGQYKEAVSEYDKALALAPGESDGGDPVGRDAAWNRAIALKRIDDQKDSGQDSGNDGGDSGQDGGKDSGKEGGQDGGQDSGNDGGSDSGGDSGQSPDSGSPDSGPPPPQDQPDAAPPPPPRANEDERMLDQLENAPTVQQEAAKKNAAHRKVRGMADK